TASRSFPWPSRPTAKRSFQAAQTPTSCAGVRNDGEPLDNSEGFEMMRCLVLAVLVVASVGAVTAADSRPAKPDPAALTAAIDRIVNEKLAANHILPAPSADDAAFFRRLNITLAGRIPVS